jgi:hypothetical protein
MEEESFRDLSLKMGKKRGTVQLKCDWFSYFVIATAACALYVRFGSPV